MILLEEELLLFKELEEEYEENDDDKIVINGDIIINVNNKGDVIDIKKTTKQIRNQFVKKSWKTKIKIRDENECQCCGKKNLHQLEVHHIMPLAKYTELASDNGNGIALCQECHRRYHEMYKDEENAVNFAKFLRDFGNRIYR